MPGFERPPGRQHDSVRDPDALGSAGEMPLATDTTVPMLFQQRSVLSGNRAAVAEKSRGIWRFLSWGEYGEQARAVGLALIGLGLRPGQTCAIVGRPSLAWAVTAHGIMGAGGIVCGLYPTTSPSEFEQALASCDARYLFVDDPAILRRIIDIRDAKGEPARIVLMREPRDTLPPDIMHLDALRDAGTRQDPQLWTRRIASLKSTDVALLAFSAGTYGPPRAAMITHRAIHGALRGLGALTSLSADDTQLAFLPMAHVVSQVGYLFWPLIDGARVHFVEAPDTLLQDLREVSPTVMIAVPKIWNRLRDEIERALASAGPVGRRAGQWALERNADALERTCAPVGGSRKYSPTFGMDALIRANLRRQFGLSGLRAAVTNGAAITPGLLRWYWSLGVPLYECYSNTESAGIACINRPGSLRPGTAGRAPSGSTVRLSDQGEVLLQSPSAFSGYLNDPSATRLALRDGWLHTGDTGCIDPDGFLTLSGRLRDVLVTSAGRTLQPESIENRLRASRLVADAVIIGEGRPFLTALIVPEEETVIRFGQEHGLSFTSFGSLCRNPAVLALIAGEVDEVNRQLSDAESIRDFRLLDRFLSVESEHLSATLKLKRRKLSEQYRDAIETMYAVG